LGQEFDLWSRDVIGHVTIEFPHRSFPIGGPLKPTTKPVALMVSEIFNGECDAMVHAT